MFVCCFVLISTTNLTTISRAVIIWNVCEVCTRGLRMYEETPTVGGAMVKDEGKVLYCHHAEPSTIWGYSVCVLLAFLVTLL